MLRKRKVLTAYNAIYKQKTPRLSEVFQSILEIDLTRQCLRSGLTLDAGCGSGRISLAIADDAHEIVGIDFSRQAILSAINVARSLNPNKFNFVLGDVEKLPFKDSSFENVMFIGTLEWASHSVMQNCLVETRRVLVDNGIVCFNCWNACSVYRLFWKLTGRIAKRLYPLRRDIELSFFSIRDLSSILRKIRLSASKIAVYLFFLPSFLDILKCLPLVFLVATDRKISNIFLGLYVSSNLWTVASKSVAPLTH